MLQHQIASGTSIAALFTVAAIAGCGETSTPPRSSSAVDSMPKHHSAVTSSNDLLSDGVDREPSRTRDEHHLEAAGKVFDIMMAEINLQTVRGWAKLLPNSSSGEQEAFAEQMLRIFRSDGFRRDYCAILMETFTTEECERLSKILSDPVLKKFQQRKAEYMAQLISLAEKHREDDGSVK